MKEIEKIHEAINTLEHYKSNNWEHIVNFLLKELLDAKV
jgi:hypothetical protein